MDEARRHVKDPPSINRLFEGAKLPDSLIATFPSVKNSKENYSNGMISISNFFLFKKIALFKDNHIDG